jgi:adhesin/invasin
MAKPLASQPRQLAQALVVGILVTGCGGDGGGNGVTPPATTTTIAKASTNSGDAQTGTVGQSLATPLSVVVTEDGAVAGATVAWSTTAPNASVNPTSAATDVNGIASTVWTLGTASGAQTATATLSGASGSPVTFTATAAAGPAATLAKAAGNNGDNQTGEINSQLPLPVQARVTDGFGNAVAGAGVNWSATGAAVSAPTVASDASGLSQVSVTLGGTAGPITIVAESDGLTGSPLTFNATAVVLTPPPTTIAITVGNDFFQSNRNTSTSPAVDTVAVNGTVTWTWAAGAITHNVTSAGSPSFTSSTTKSAPASHQFTFTSAGTYRYYCSVHSSANATAGMVGRIVVR